MYCRTNTFLIALLLLSIGSACGAPSNKLLHVVHGPLGQGQVWSLRQSSLILGEFGLLANKEGLRAACKRSGIVVVARAPQWTAVAFSERSGKIWRPARDKFTPVHDQYKSLAVLGLPSIWLIPVVHCGSKVVSDLACEDFSTSASWGKEQATQLKQKLINETYPLSASYQATQVNLPAQAYGIIEQIYGVPSCSLLPVQFSFTDFRKVVTVGLTTKSCQMIKPPQDWLEIPINLKTVNSFSAVNMDRGAQSGAEELFGN